MNFPKKLSELKQHAKSLLNDYVCSLEDSIYKSFFVYNLTDSGKLIRPIIVSIVEDALGISSGKLDSFKIALEMVHVSSLIHDDLPGIDNDSLRRGMPSAHVKFGEGFAILGGDLVFSKALSKITDDRGLNDREKVVLLTTLIEAQNQLCEGQILDLDLRKRVLSGVCDNFSDQATAAKLLDNLNLKKTGALFIAAALGPAKLEGLKKEDLNHLVEIMGNIAKIFQLRDDIIDSNHDSRPENDLEINYVSTFGRDVVLESINSLFENTIDKMQVSNLNLSLLSELLKTLLNPSTAKPT